MAYQALAVLCFFATLVLNISIGMPSGKLRTKRQTSAFATLMSFSIKLSDMQRLITSYEKQIDRQRAVIDGLSARINSKADRSQFRELQTLLASKMSNLKNEINDKEIVIERYRNKLGQLEAQITEINQEYANLNDHSNEVRSKFDDFGLDCSSELTAWAPRADGPILYLDRQWVRCAQDQFVQWFMMELASNYKGDMVRYRYRCCRINF